MKDLANKLAGKIAGVILWYGVAPIARMVIDLVMRNEEECRETSPTPSV